MARLLLTQFVHNALTSLPSLWPNSDGLNGHVRRVVGGKGGRGGTEGAASLNLDLTNIQGLHGYKAKKSHLCFGPCDLFSAAKCGRFSMTAQKDLSC